MAHGAAWVKNVVKVAQRCAAFSMTSVRVFEFDDERVAGAVIENLNLAFSTHFEQGLVQFVGLILVGDHRQELVVGQN
jgi:hypothetical protein